MLMWRSSRSATSRTGVPGSDDADEDVAERGVGDGRMAQMARFRQPGAAAITAMNTLIPTVAPPIFPAYDEHQVANPVENL